jgi:hypothetical protein
VQRACASGTSRSPRCLGKLGVDALEYVIERRRVDQLQQGHVNSMAKVGRNQPCPCGSGKKYKQCCLAIDDPAAAAAREPQRRDQPPPPIRPPHFSWQPPVDDTEQVDQLSNGIVDLIQAGKLDEAERMSRRLVDEFSDFPDGHMRLGAIFRARGEPKQAAQHLRLAATIARSADVDSELPRSLEDEADALDPPNP